MGQTNDEIIQAGHDLTQGRGIGAQAIFLTGYIAPVVQTVFNAPIRVLQNSTEQWLGY